MGGMRQGCPHSCLLFALVVKILAQSIRKDQETRGSLTGVIKQHLIEFADDMSCFLKPEDDISCLFSTIAIFTNYAGLQY